VSRLTALLEATPEPRPEDAPSRLTGLLEATPPPRPKDAPSRLTGLLTPPWAEEALAEGERPFEARRIALRPGERAEMRPQTWGQATGGALVHGAAGTAEATLRVAEREAESGFGWLTWPARKLAELFPRKGKPPIRASMAEYRRQVAEAKKLAPVHPGMRAAESLRSFQEDHPDWAPQQVQTAADLFENPKALVSNLAAMIPYMAATTAAYLAAGPGASALIAYAVEGQSDYERAIANDATEEQAAWAARFGGAIKAVIEQLQVGGWIKFGRRGAQAVLSKEVSRRAMRKMLLGEGAKLAVGEGLEEVLQGTTEDLVAMGVYGAEIPKGFWNRRSIEGVLGSIGGLVMGGGTSVAFMGARQLARPGPIQPPPAAPIAPPAIKPPPAAPPVIKPAPPAAPPIEAPPKAPAVEGKQPWEIPRAERVRTPQAEREAIGAFLSQFDDPIAAARQGEIGPKEYLPSRNELLAEHLNKHITPTKLPMTPYGKSLGQLGPIEDARDGIAIGLAYGYRPEDVARYVIQNYIPHGFEILKGKPVPAEVLAEYPALARPAVEGKVEEAKPPAKAELREPTPELTEKELKGLRIKAGRLRAKLRREIVAQIEKETDYDAEWERRGDISETVASGEQYGVEVSFSFSGKIPAEVMDEFDGGVVPIKYRKYIKGNVPYSTGEESLAALGTDEWFRRLDNLIGGKKGDVERTIAYAKEWAEIIQDPVLAMKIQQYEALRGADFPNVQIVRASALDKGDTFTVGGEKYRVISKEPGQIEVEDGVSGAIESKTGVPIDEGSLERVRPELHPTPAVIEASKRKLRRKIMATAIAKGLPKTQIQEIAKKHGGFRHLRARKVGLPELEKILKAVQRARPRRVRGRRVVLQKTEKKIQTLKERLIGRAELTEEDFRRQLNEMRIKQPAYIDAQNFITEKQAHELIQKMIDEAPIIRARESTRRAVGKKGMEGVKAHRDGLNKEIGKRRTKRAIYGKPAKVGPLWSMRYVTSRMEEQTGLSFNGLWEAMNKTHLEIRQEIEQHHKRIESASPEYQRIAKDRAASARISDYIASKLARGPRPYPRGITSEEIRVAQAIEGVLAQFRPLVRLAKFLDYYYKVQDIPEGLETEVHKATDIYESQGLEAVKEYLADKEWGIIRRGYEPEEIITGRIRLRRPGAIAFGRGHIRVREGPARAQERTIFQRVDSYVRQILNKTKLEQDVRALVRLFDEHTDSFANPRQSAEQLSSAINEAKGYPETGGPLGRFVRRLAGQVMRVIFIRPVLSVRNLFQNMAFNEDFTLGVLVDPRNKTLTEADRRYFDIYVDQTRAVHRQYLMQEEKPFRGFGWTQRIADRLAHYPLADKLNRLWAYWGRINRVRRAMRDTDFTSPQSVKRMMDKGGFASLEPIQQRSALEILASKGPDVMARYVAAAHTMNVHFAYERAQRSPAEMGAGGRTWGSLFAFPRSWAERIVLEARKVKRGGTYTTRRRALGRLFQMSVIALLVGEGFKRLLGRKRNPYNPLNILTWQPGGLVVGAVEELAKGVYLLTRAGMGDRQALGQFIAQIPRLAKLYVPLYDALSNLADATTGMKNVDRYALRLIRQEFDKSYKVRKSAYQAERNLVEAFQEALFGSEPQEKRKEKEPSATRRTRREARRRARR